MKSGYSCYTHSFNAFLNGNTISNTFYYDDYPVVVDSDEVKCWNFGDLWHLLGCVARTLSLRVPLKLHFDRLSANG